jgi:PTS system N-acetylglucosamine-specific IIC component
MFGSQLCDHTEGSADSYRLGTNGWMLIPVGLVYFLIYYFLFSFAIRKFNLATPGRVEAVLEPSAEAVPVTSLSAPM